MHQCTELRRKALDLLAPVAEYRRRRDNESWQYTFSFLPLLEQAGNDLQGFAQAHIVCQAGVQTQVFQVLEPGDTTLLVVTQGSLQGLWIFNRGERILVMKSGQ